MLAVVLVCAAIVVLSVSHEIYDPDQWQHLTVGRFIWEQHRFPTTQLWTWPTYGAKDVDYAWGFEALVWPLWHWGGILGLYAWRWLATLAAFGLAWAAARRMGARGLVPLVVIALCAMVYRGRSQVRPETVAAVLLTAEIALLEARRHGARIHAGWLVPLAWVWANTHISYYLFFAVLGIHALAALLPSRRDGAASGRGLWLAGLAAFAVSFLNPSGWRTLWQPFEFWLVWRHEPIYRFIGEMGQVKWSLNWLDGLPLLLVLWPLLVLRRAARSRFDRVEAMMCALFSLTLLVAARFMGAYALVAAVYLSRDLDEWARALRPPAWAAAPWVRAGLAAAACLLVTGPEMARTSYPIRLHFPANRFPVAASDFIRRHDLHGHMFNQYDIGGYLCFRFWPRREQLPFMGIHQEGTPELRRLYAQALYDEVAWQRLEQRYGFDYLVLLRGPVANDGLLAFVDRDTGWVRVFRDDAACVFVRGDGPFARLAADSGYRTVPSDPARLAAFGQATTRDSTLRRRAERELWREAAGSPWHARALDLLVNIALFEGRWVDARRELEEALRIDPEALGAREKLGIIALQLGRPHEALRWFEAEHRVIGYRGGLDLRRGQVAQAMGDLRRAQALYRRELRRTPGDQETRDSLGSVTRRLGR
jgi:tetratricopeptide (TPR) repeat protein